MGTRDNNKALTWIRRLSPWPDESLASFLGRWARENVMTSRPNLLGAVEVSRAIRVLPRDLGKLALALGLEQSVLLSIAPADEPSRPVLRRSHTRPGTEAVCPHCLADASYSRQLWSHCLATACPTHGTRLVDTCQRCGAGIRHDRPLPHLCECGADLRLETTSTATAAEVEFAKLLMGMKSEVPALPFDLDDGVPPELDLFVWGIANHFCHAAGGISARKAGKSPLPKTVEQAVDRLVPVFDLLDDWPNRFDQQLKLMVETALTTESTGTAARLGRWYFFLFRKYQHEAFKPFRVAAANRIVQSHDGLLNSRTHNVQDIATVQKNWFSVKEASLELRVAADRINDGIDRCLIRARIHDEAVGYRQRFIDFEEIKRLQKIQYEHINETTAMAILQVPKAVYRLVCDAGWITSSNPEDVAPVVSGYIQHVPLLSLMDRLRKSAPTDVCSSSAAFVRLRDLNLRRTTDQTRLIGLFRAIAAGELLPIGHDENLTVGGLMFSQAAVDERIASWFVARGLTLQQVSELTGAHYDAVTAWVEMGLLQASREPMEQGAPWVVSLQDYTNFLQTYVPLARQANVCSSSTRGLTSRLERLGLKPIEPEGGRGALLRLTDFWDVVKRSDSETQNVQVD
jgi:hypothetical protein